MFTKKPRKPIIDCQEEQREKLKELGSLLHQVRTEKRISIDTVSKKTLIPVRLIKAIEAGNWDALPEPIYIRGLIKQFADFLGLNGAELTQDFSIDLHIKQVKSTFWWRLPSLQLRPFHLYLFYVLLVIISVKSLSNWLKQSTLELGSLPTPVPSVVVPSPIVKPTPSPVKPTPVDDKSTAKPLVVDIKLKDKSWLKVVVDGKTEFEGVLPQGTHKTWTAKQQLTLRTGNAGGILVAFNDQQAKELGKPGQVQEVTFQVNPRS